MNKWNFYTTNEIKPRGWLRRQLEIQAEGLAGNLDKVWRDVRDSWWIGGEAEDWERAPYWLDGFVPLAYLLENEDMIARAKKYIDAILDRQHPDGWLCPFGPEQDKQWVYSSWPLHLVCKMLLLYYRCSGDERIPDVLYRAMRCHYELLRNGSNTLSHWGQYRWYEAFFTLNFLYERHGEEWIIELAHMLREQGAKFVDELDQWKRPLSKVVMITHIVGIAMMLKYEALSHDLLGEEYTDRAEYFRRLLEAYNGTPVGLFTGDEHLSGLSPIQGTELCAVVDQMLSYEILFAHTGDMRWLERLEVLAFNALPASISDDMWTHQYVQQSNQINCITFPRKPIFGTNNAEAHLFGLEPNFGCCTANHGQGWPKLALSAFMHRDDEVLSAVPVPSVLTADVGTVELATNYPFETALTYKIDAKQAFTLRVRIPSFARKLTVDGAPVVIAAELAFPIAAGEQREIRVAFEAEVELMERPHTLRTVKYGSLVFSLPIAYEKVMHEYERGGVERKFPYCDYEYVGRSDWNYGFSDVEFVPEKREISDIPFSSEKPPVVVKAKMKKIPWGIEPGYEHVCAKVPMSTQPIGDEEIKELYPYGCAKLRMTEMPMVW